MGTLLLIFAALAVLLLAAAYGCYRAAFTVPRADTLNPLLLPHGSQYRQRYDEMRAMIGAAVNIPCQEVTVRSFDGLQLHARYYETAPGAPLQILCHGYQSNPLQDFSGGLPLALESGCNVLLIDQRAHGHSQGKCLTFGIREREDCLSWIHYALERFGPSTPIVLVGISMGAATVLMATALELPKNVVGVISDCGYSSPKAIIRKVLKDRGYPVSLAYPLLRLGATIFGGFDPDSCSPEEALRECRVPVLFIHGEDDRFVPCDMTRINYAACASPKTLHTFPGAGHGLSYLVDEKRYRAAVAQFLTSVGIA